jgi:hypothetical protein
MAMKIFNLYDVELNMLNINIQQKVVKVIIKNLEFLKTFDFHKFTICGSTWNSMVLMLNPHFKSL